MADAANPATRNLMPRRNGHPGPMDYVDGLGNSYGEQLRKCSWPTNWDIPAIGQKSANEHLPALRAHRGFADSNHFLHPTNYLAMRHSDHLSYAKCNDELGILWNGNPQEQKVHDRLYLGSRVVQKPPRARRCAGSVLEMAGDVAFQCVEPEDAAPLYTKAISQTPHSIFAYEKRCAALAELGRYREALDDAKYIRDHLATAAEHGAALARVKALEDYMRRMDNFEPGYHQATTTLICLLRPREYRQLTQSRPSTYGRPLSQSRSEKAIRFGKGLTSSGSMGSILGWDTDGDGNIDMSEFREKVSQLGYTPKKKEREVFASTGDRTAKEI